MCTRVSECNIMLEALGQRVASRLEPIGHRVCGKSTSDGCKPSAGLTNPTLFAHYSTPTVTQDDNAYIEALTMASCATIVPQPVQVRCSACCWRAGSSFAGE